MRKAQTAAALRLPLKRGIARLYGALKQSVSAPRVLLYHSVGDGPLATPREVFETQIRWLSRNCKITDLPTALSAGVSASSDRSAAITFDDGYASLRTTALGILQEARATATVYLNTKFIADGHRMQSQIADGHYPLEDFLNWEDVEVLRSAGWIVGSHGEGHFDLTQLSPRALEAELLRSKAAIETRTGEPCLYVSYPWGRHNTAVKQAVSRMGYLSGAAAFHGAIGAGTDRFAFPRIAIDREWTMDDFRAAFVGDWDYLGWLQRRRQISS